MKYLLHLPHYIAWQIQLRMPGEAIAEYNKWQPQAKKENLKQFVDNQDKDYVTRGSWLIWKLIIALIGLVIILLIR